jgi:Lung seven transmembrane receptor
MIVSAAKHSFGRCLLLMVAMGWGVVRASLARHTFMAIVAMGTFYLTASAMFDIYYMIDWGGDDGSNGSTSGDVQSYGSGQQEETAISDFLQICFWLTFYIDIVFMIWIPSAMCQTMHYLKTTNQLRKLERYQVLLKIMIGAVVLTIITVIVVFTEAFGLSFMDINEGNEFNFFIILTFVAVVWRPNPNAREFAYAMELGTGDDENDNGTTDLELVADSACDFQQQQQQQQQSRRSNNGTYEGGGAPTIDRAEPA